MGRGKLRFFFNWKQRVIIWNKQQGKRTCQIKCLKGVSHFTCFTCAVWDFMAICFFSFVCYFDGIQTKFVNKDTYVNNINTFLCTFRIGQNWPNLILSLHKKHEHKTDNLSDPHRCMELLAKDQPDCVSLN